MGTLLIPFKLMRAEDIICYLDRGRTSYQLELLLTYNKYFIRAYTNYVPMNESSYMHYTIDGQDYGCRSSNDYDLLNFETTPTMEEKPLMNSIGVGLSHLFFPLEL